MVSISLEQLYVFDAASRLWVLGKPPRGACLLQEETAGGRLAALLPPADAQYLKDTIGANRVMRSMMLKIEQRDFAQRLDVLPPGSLPFADGVLFDAAGDTTRPVVREDFLTATVGYAFVSAADAAPSMRARIRTFYEHVFPVDGEREYFQRVVANALFGGTLAKLFLVHTDERDGDNGKTTLMRAVEAVVGAYAAAGNRDFLYMSANAQPEGHSANLLSFAGKRLAFYDEPDSDKKLDARKIKDLSSGDARIRGREINAGRIANDVWEALIVIACNQANFPVIDGNDRAMIKRLKVLKMRSLFVDPKALAGGGGAEADAGAASGSGGGTLATENVDADEDEGEGADTPEPNTFLKIEDLKNVLQSHDGVIAHLHELADAYRRMRAAGGFGDEPESVREMVNKILEDADPCMLAVMRVLDERINFEPVRAPDFKGRTYYAWLTQKQVAAKFWQWYDEYKGKARGARPSQFKG